MSRTRADGRARRIARRTTACTATFMLAVVLGTPAAAHAETAAVAGGQTFSDAGSVQLSYEVVGEPETATVATSTADRPTTLPKTGDDALCAGAVAALAAAIGAFAKAKADEDAER